MSDLKNSSGTSFSTKSGSGNAVFRFVSRYDLAHVPGEAVPPFEPFIAQLAMEFALRVALGLVSGVVAFFLEHLGTGRAGKQPLQH